MQIREKWKHLGNKTRYFIITGGRGSGKSYEVTKFATLLTFEQNETVLFTRKTLTSAHISIIPEFADKVENLKAESEFSINKTDISNNQTGSKILFRGIQSSSKDNTANLKSLQGVTCWILDEAEELTDEATFDRIDLSVRDNNKQNRVILILNPATKEHWVYKRFFESTGVHPGFTGVSGDVTYIHSDYRDNEENLSPSFLQQVRNLELANPRKYQHVILGGWLDKAEGVVFTNWRIGDFEDVAVPVWGADFGFSIDPSTLVKVCIDKSRKKIFANECYYRPKLTTSEIASLMKHHAGNGLIYADSAEPRLIDELVTHGLNIKPTEKGAGSITAGIAALQDYELIIDPDSINLVKELNNYVWSDKKSNTPIDAFNHCFIGETLVTTNKGLVPIRDVREGDMVLTSMGYKKVLKKFNNGVKQVSKYRMQSDTFSVYLCSTKEHKIKSDTWKSISELQSGMMVYQHKDSIAKILGYSQRKSIFHEGQKECTFTFGNIITAKSLKDIISIIKTKTFGIIPLKTWNAWKAESIYQTTVNKGLLRIHNFLRISNQRALKKQRNGISQKRVASGIQNTEEKHGLIGSTKHTLVSNVQNNLNQGMEELSSFAITTVKLKHFAQEESWSEEVYDIHVEDCHEYFANGILVHNCIDALRYATYPELQPKQEYFFF